MMCCLDRATTPLLLTAPETLACARARQVAKVESAASQAIASKASELNELASQLARDAAEQRAREERAHNEELVAAQEQLRLQRERDEQQLEQMKRRVDELEHSPTRLYMRVRAGLTRGFLRVGVPSVLCPPRSISSSFWSLVHADAAPLRGSCRQLVEDRKVMIIRGKELLRVLLVPERGDYECAL